MILLDTHALIWLGNGDSRLGKTARGVLEEAHIAGELGISAISFWEVAMLIEKKRIEIGMSVHAWRQDLLSAGLQEMPVDGDIGISAATLDEFHGDPADRIIVSTAILRNGVLLTADQKILGWEGQLMRQDAER